MCVEVISVDTLLYLATLGRKNFIKMQPGNEIYRKY